ncbi:hypothetical protein BWK59_05855 [Flavobacterium davisii]|uniref:Uncharacterized protein n=1 Tax=Flavobacterium davisii TaxID=2906077 RepID=A0A2D0AIP4_9FLAO|nr:hypothetical protein [Flavobacterium davisii]OWP84347.1 hypothetical protein BWK59_05855 [Flavobacterium davisii]
MNKSNANPFAERKAKGEQKVKQEPKVVENKLEAFIERFGQTQLDEWKHLYGNRLLIYLKLDNFLAVLRPPTAEDLGEYLMSVGTVGMNKAVLMIVETLWLDGDYELIQDEDNFMFVFLQVNNFLEGKKGEFFRA